MRVNISGSVTENFKPETVRGQAVSLMRSLIMMCSTLQPLPDDRILDIEVQYYKDITPESYQPAHFKLAKSKADKSKLEKKGLSIDIGNCRTPFHGLSLTILCEEQKVDAELLAQVRK